VCLCRLQPDGWPPIVVLLAAFWHVHLQCWHVARVERINMQQSIQPPVANSPVNGSCCKCMHALHLLCNSKPCYVPIA
jgi:hypothetical protein